MGVIHHSNNHGFNPQPNFRFGINSKIRISKLGSFCNAISLGNILGLPYLICIARDPHWSMGNHVE